MHFEGYVQPEHLPVRAGDEVIIPEGVPLTSTHPNFENGQESQKKYRVTVDHVLPGFKDKSDLHNRRSKPPEVVWAGSGGYWKSASINDIQLIPRYFRKQLIHIGENHPEGVRQILKNSTKEELQTLLDHPTLQKLLTAEQSLTRRIVLRYTGHPQPEGRTR